jgi:hypothetical protein
MHSAFGEKIIPYFLITYSSNWKRLLKQSLTSVSSSYGKVNVDSNKLVITQGGCESSWLDYLLTVFQVESIQRRNDPKRKCRAGEWGRGMLLSQDVMCGADKLSGQPLCVHMWQ